MRGLSGPRPSLNSVGGDVAGAVCDLALSSAPGPNRPDQVRLDSGPRLHRSHLEILYTN